MEEGSWASMERYYIIAKVNSWTGQMDRADLLLRPTELILRDSLHITWPTGSNLALLKFRCSISNYVNRNLSLNSGPNPLFVFRSIQYPGSVQKKPAACHRFEFRFSTSSLSLMDLIAAPDTAEAYTLRTISRPYEIEKWTSHAVRMRISRTIAGGFGTVYCVFAHPSKWRVLISTIVVRRKHSGCIPLLK